MRARLGLAGAVAALAAVALGSASAAAQPPPAPLKASLFFVNPPPNATFGPTTPITIVLQLQNASGAPIITTEGFSATAFWRKLYFALDGVGTITNQEPHRELLFGTCHYRGDAVLPGAGLQVTPVEVLATDFGVQFTIDPRAHFDLSRPGRYTVTASIPVLAFRASSVINDCNIEFSGKSLVNIGSGSGTGRQSFEIVSNSLEFFIQPSDVLPPTTNVDVSPAPNAGGWNNQDVTVRFTAADNPGGAGVKDIIVTLFGAQAGTQTLPGAAGAVTITAEGTTTVFFNAEDNASNSEAVRSQTIRLDKTRPAVTAPAAIGVAATETGGARPSASPGLTAFLNGGSATDNLDPAPARLTAQVGGVDVTSSTLFPPGPTAVTFRFRDAAGNIGTATSTVTVTTAAGKAEITGTIVAGDVINILLRSFDIKFTNTGTAVARNVVIKQFSFKTLQGVGIIIYDPFRSPKLPISLGDLPVGASKTIRVYLLGLPTVQKFSMTETGEFRDAAGKAVSFATTQIISRRRDRDEFREDK